MSPAATNYNNNNNIISNNNNNNNNKVSYARSLLNYVGDKSGILPKDLFLTKRVTYKFAFVLLQRQELTNIKLQGLTAKRK